MLRGVRGAITVLENDAEEILSATRELLEAILAANPEMKSEDLGAAWFTLSEDLDAVYPAQAARQIGWQYVPLMCAQEIPVPGGLRSCVRVLLLWNTEQPQEEICHIYLRGAAVLRPDLLED